MQSAATPAWTNEARALAGGFGQPLTQAQAERLWSFCQLLLTWNQRINLTGAGSPEELLREHLCDSFALSAVLAPSVRLLDVGSGGGLPAVPLAILRPDVALTLVEPRAKRAAFLRQALRALNLVASIEQCRLEELTPANFDAANARATFAPAQWQTLGRPFVRAGGDLVFLVPAATDLPFPAESARQLLHYRAGDKPRCIAALTV